MKYTYYTFYNILNGNVYRVDASAFNWKQAIELAKDYFGNDYFWWNEGYLQPKTFLGKTQHPKESKIVELIKIHN